MIIRDAQPGDERAIFELIQGLATFENDSEAVINTSEQLRADLFEHHYCEAFVAEVGGKIVGFSLFYTAYSTWKGAVIYLEDLYVLPEHRGKGAGSRLFDAVVAVARNRKCVRMDWQVLDWNVDAIAFYERKGARIDKDWFNGRMFFPENESK